LTMRVGRPCSLRPAWPEARLRAPPIAQDREEQQANGLVRITMKKAYRDGTVAVDMIHFRFCAGWPARSLPLGDERASTTIPHDPLCGGARRGKSMALARDAFTSSP